MKVYLVSLQHKQNNALLKAVNAMNNKANIQCNKTDETDVWYL